MRYRHLVFVVVLPLLSGCGGSSDNSNSLKAAQRKFDQLELEQVRQDFIKRMNQPAQDATRSDLARVLPDWHPVGWSFQRSQADQKLLDRAALFRLEQDVKAVQSQPVIVTVDLARGSEHKVLSAVARQFTDELGNKYYRTEPLTPELRELFNTPEKSSEPHDERK